MLALLTAGCGSDGTGYTPLRVLVTNDDGFAAEGIDAIVQALVSDSRNEVTVCAPSGNRSGSADMTGPSQRCGDLEVTAETTLGGYPATAVNGCPADAVNYALMALYAPNAPPHVVISGINAGQNVSEPVATRLSGTVGAARTAARNGIPALAASQGGPAVGGTFDYPAGVDAVLRWLEENRRSLQTGVVRPTDIDSINIPSCAGGTSIRGTLAGLPLAPTTAGIFDAQDCASTLEDPQNDVEAFVNGYVTLSDVPLEN
jgi:5'-nucleotidase